MLSYPPLKGGVFICDKICFMENNISPIFNFSKEKVKDIVEKIEKIIDTQPDISASDICAQLKNKQESFIAGWILGIESIKLLYNIVNDEQ